MTKNKDEPKPDFDHLKWSIDKRADVQRTLLALYTYVRCRPAENVKPIDIDLLDDLIGAAFSLWRAVFLVDTLREDTTVHDSQEQFLAKVISDNSITFADDKINRHWTVGYYLENAKLRLRQTLSYVDDRKSTTLQTRLGPSLHFRGTENVRLTQYEWECLHHVLGEVLLILHPTSDYQPVRPQMPKFDED